MLHTNLIWIFTTLCAIVTTMANTFADEESHLDDVLDDEDYDIRRHLQDDVDQEEDDNEEEENTGYYRIYPYAKPIGRLQSWSKMSNDPKSWSAYKLEEPKRKLKPKAAKKIVSSTRRSRDERQYETRSSPKRKKVQFMESRSTNKSFKDQKKGRSFVLIPVTSGTERYERKKESRPTGLWEEAKLWAAFTPKPKPRRTVKSKKGHWENHHSTWK